MKEHLHENASRSLLYCERFLKNINRLKPLQIFVTYGNYVFKSLRSNNNLGIWKKSKSTILQQQWYELPTVIVSDNGKSFIIYKKKIQLLSNISKIPNRSSDLYTMLIFVNI